MPTTLIVALALTVATATQSRPDFSGRWILESSDPPSVDAVVSLVVKQPIPHTSVGGHPLPAADDRWISIERQRASGITTERRDIGIIGGVVGGVVAGQPKRSRSATTETRWRDMTLVFVDSVQGADGPGGGGWSERRESWSLLTDGRLRVVVVNERLGQASQTGVFVYRRQ